MSPNELIARFGEEQVLTFLVFGDGCAAALVSSDEEGLALDRFHAVVTNDAADQITWNVRDQGFDMVLSGQVPASVGVKPCDCEYAPAATPSPSVM